MRKADVLIAVAPQPLLRIIEHLFERPDFQIVESLTEWTDLAREACRLHPNVIVMNMTLLGYGAAKILSDIRFASPTSNLILISFPHDVRYHARRWGADAYLEEEKLVQQLVPTAQRLLAKPKTVVKKSRTLAVTVQHSEKHRK